LVMKSTGKSLEEVLSVLASRGGLLGLSGVSGDFRDIEEAAAAGNARARLALEVFAADTRRYLGAYLVELGGAEAIVFTGGIGENSPEVRSRICQGMDFLGICLDEERNQAAVGGKEGDVAADAARVRTFVIPTNEELLIARDTVRCVRNAPRRW
jgi:acetate kinase